MRLNFLFLSGLFILFSLPAVSQQEGTTDGNICLKCHSRSDYSFTNAFTGKEEKRLMNPYYILDTAQIRKGVHRHFKCTDCHSTDYETWPHNGDLKLEPLNTCLDCHGGDETYAKYHFERIDSAFQASVHFTQSGDIFSCAKCHNPHYYHPMARNSENVLETVKYDNNMCLGCHSNKDKFNLLSQKGLYDVIDRHEWLPNHTLHFANARCIECHTQVNDSLLVSHTILPKEKARRLCVECHSANSILMASLYKYELKENRNKLGYVNAAILNDSYVIGANRNFYLNLISIVLFGCVLAGIALHTILRLRKVKK
jgi:hypothetical protein